MSFSIGLHAGSDTSKTQYEAFSTWLGQSVTTRIVFADNSSWSGIQSPYMLGTTKTWLAKGSQYREVITIGLCPTASTPSSTGVHLSAVASGSYDSYFTNLGANLANMGNNPATGKPYANQIVIRLGHELNGDWYQWGIGGTASNKPGSWNTPTDYINAYRRVVGLIRSKASGVKFDCNYAMNGRTISGGFAGAYPGNSYVDYVSADVYDDFYTGNWLGLLNGTGGIQNGGLTAFRSFAASNNKPEAYPEWACDTSSNGKGDSIVFIIAMIAWFMSVGSNGVGYQSYYDTSAWAGNAVIHTGTVTCPRASQSYRTLLSKANLVLTKIAGSLVNGIFTPVSTPPKNLGSYCDGSNFYYLS